jgi:hypothetical protein
MAGFVEIAEKKKVGDFRVGKKIIAHHIEGNFKTGGQGLTADIVFDLLEFFLEQSCAWSYRCSRIRRKPCARKQESSLSWRWDPAGPFQGGMAFSALLSIQHYIPALVSIN